MNPSFSLDLSINLIIILYLFRCNHVFVVYLFFHHFLLIYQYIPLSKLLISFFFSNSVIVIDVDQLIYPAFRGKASPITQLLTKWKYRPGFRRCEFDLIKINSICKSKSQMLSWWVVVGLRETNQNKKNMIFILTSKLFFPCNIRVNRYYAVLF